MPGQIPNLWPDDIETEVVSPVVILRTQAIALSSVTKGVLEARVTTVEGEESMAHDLDIVAPALGYEHRILTVAHGKELVYPATLMAMTSPGEAFRGECFSEHDLIVGLREVLSSPGVKSVIHSLIARSNELQLKAAASS